MENQTVIKPKGINYNGLQLVLLVTLRVLIGWHLLYEGVVKLMNPDWTSVGYLLDSRGFLGWFFHSLTNNPDIVKIVDLLNIWGLIIIGSFLILGLFTRVVSIAGISLLGLYFLSHVPLIGVTYAVPSEGSYLFVNKNLIEAVAISLFLVFPTGRIGIDRFIFKQWAKNY